MATQYRSPGWPSHYTGDTTHNGTRVTTSTPYRPSPKYTTVADSSSDLTGTQLWSCTGFRLCQLLLPSQCSCVFRENCLEASNKELTQICICPWLRTSYWQFKEVKQRTVLQIKYFIWCMHEINNSQYNQWLYSTAINAASHSHCFHPHLWACELKLEERWTKLRFPRLWQVPTEQAGPRVGPSGRGTWSQVPRREPGPGWESEAHSHHLQTLHFITVTMIMICFNMNVLPSAFATTSNTASSVVGWILKIEQ